MLSILKMITQFNQENEPLYGIYQQFFKTLSNAQESTVEVVKLDMYKQIVHYEGIASDDQINNLNEREFVNMIESYTTGSSKNEMGL